jgi:trimethylamine--corrinoid protein Co-methyltransferase
MNLLDTPFIERILSEAFELLQKPGIRLQCRQAAELLASSGASIEGETARIPETLVEQALTSVPRQFDLCRRDGSPAVHYGGTSVAFDPGSCAVHVLDPATGEHRPSQSADLLRLVQVAEGLPQFAAQSTAVVCHDAPPGVPGDLYRLYLVLLHSDKPVVTGAFSAETLPAMLDLLLVDEMSSFHQPTDKHRAVFDVCPSPPLCWTEFAARNLIDLAQAGVPAEIVSMPLAGAAAPVTLAGALVQHAAECLSGIVIHQLAHPGAPVVWGGAPAIFDMRAATTPVGAIETAMLCAAYAQVGQRLGLPTHAYLGASDAKLVDAQAGLESGMTALVGALAGINLISGAGMLDFLACQSVEKLVIDAEGIAMAQRLLRGIEGGYPSLAVEAFARAGLGGEFLKLEETRRLFRQEQYLPSKVIERGSMRAWQEAGAQDAFQRARRRADALVAAYHQPELPEEVERSMKAVVNRFIKREGEA